MMALTVWQRAEAIRANLGGGKLPYAEQVARQRENDAHKRAIIREYAAARGWTRARHAAFSLECLAEGRIRRSRALYSLTLSRSRPLLDHLYWFKAGRLPAAIVSHPYRFWEGEPPIREWAASAAELGLAVTVPDDFPSWWYPGWTVLIELLPLAARGSFLISRREPQAEGRALDG
jgi:hypothetical protein